MTFFVLFCFCLVCCGGCFCFVLFFMFCILFVLFFICFVLFCVLFGFYGLSIKVKIGILKTLIFVLYFFCFQFCIMCAIPIRYSLSQRIINTISTREIFTLYSEFHIEFNLNGYGRRMCIFWPHVHPRNAIQTQTLDLFYFPSKTILTTKHKTESKMAEVQLKVKCLRNVAPPLHNYFRSQSTTSAGTEVSHVLTRNHYNNNNNNAFNIALNTNAASKRFTEDKNLDYILKSTI